MPIYEYCCEDCDNKFDLFFHTIDKGQKAEEDGDIECPKCKCHKIYKVFSCFNVEKLYPTLGSRGSAFAGGSESNMTRKPGYKRINTSKKTKKKVNPK